MTWSALPLSLRALSEKEEELTETPAGMRALIERFAYNDQLTHHVLEVGRFQGMSTCAVMTTLAFQALRDRQRLIDEQLKRINHQTSKIIFSSEGALHEENAGKKGRDK